MEFPVIDLPSGGNTPTAPGLDASLDSDAGGVTAPFVPGARDDVAAPRREVTQDASVSFNLLGLPSAGASMLASSGSHRRPASMAAPFIAGSPDDASFSHSVLCNGLTPVLDGVLCLGSYRDVCDPAACAEHGIQAYLCAAADIRQPLPLHVNRAERHFEFELDDDAEEEQTENPEAPPVPFCHLPMRDAPEQELATHIRTACAFIDEQAAAGRRVALYCQAGRSRSVSIAVAYMVYRAAGRLTAEDAIEQLRAIYPRADPNIGFMSQLCNPGS